MTMQEAAEKLLLEEGNPLTSKELAKRALDRGLVTSNSKDQIFSLATTIDKNIRDNIYNKPQLIFMDMPDGRFIGLPSWNKRHLSETKEPKPAETMRTISLKIPIDLLEKIEMAVFAKIADSFEQTVIHILEKGLTVVTPSIKDNLSRQMKKLDD